MRYESTHPSLLTRVRDPADRVAWREFEARYGPLIVGYCRSLGLQLTDAEDVCQEVMLSLSHALPGFRYDQETGSWLSMSGVNVTLGLPIIRSSVDHGVAFGKAGEGRANPESMVQAIKMAVRLV